MLILDVDAQEARDVRAGEHPEEAEDDDDGADEGGANDEARPGERAVAVVGADTVEDGGELQADDDEDESVEGEVDGVPDGARVEAGTGS